MLIASDALAIDAHIETVEHRLFLQKDGVATHVVDVQWQIGAGETMRGFDYEGIGFMPTWHPQKCRVKSPEGEFLLSIQGEGSRKWLIGVANKHGCLGPVFGRFITQAT